MTRYAMISLAVFGILTQVAAAQSEGTSGFFRVDAAGAKEGIYLFVEQQGPAIRGYELSTGTPVMGDVNGPGSFDLKLYVPGSGQFARARVNGRLSSPKLHGMVEFDQGSMTVEIIRIDSTWQCENHTPKHIAESPQQMKDNSARHQCTGWSPVPRKPAK